MTAQQIAHGGGLLADAISRQSRSAVEAQLDDLVDECNRRSETEIRSTPGKSIRAGEWRGVADFAGQLLKELFYRICEPSKVEMAPGAFAAGDDDASLASLAESIRRCRVLAESE